MEYLRKDDPKIAELVLKEDGRMENTLNLIAAENHAPKSIMEVMGSIFNTKTIEGYPGHRFHAGCEYVDKVERLAVDRAMRLFGAEYANVQPHSGTSANLAVYFSVLSVGDRVLAMSLPHGGHLSHGHKASITSKCFRFDHYTVNPKTELIDYDLVREIALKYQPKMIVVGASSYPRLIDYERMATIAKEVSAYLLADMAHLSGLVAGKVIPSPVPHCDFVTFTCYKTMMGGRGGVILAKKDYAKKLNSAVFPGGQGTSSVSLIAAKAVIFKLAEGSKFIQLQHKTVEHAALLGQLLIEKGYRLVTGGSDNHQVVVDLEGKSVSGSKAEKLLEACGIVANRNVVPRDAESPGQVSGLRLGTAAVTARGMGKSEMAKIADWFDQVLREPENQAAHASVSKAVKEMCGRFPIYASGNNPLAADG
ncbi:MAG: serine hydroxymethyltransferase [Desulfobulbus propionicus]|nr:MAG: serine hydroxymethyltransferase [Desulfobulbus propionicus]